MKFRLLILAVVLSAFNGYAFASGACDTQLREAALAIDPRVQSGASHCQVENIEIYDSIGDGYGLVGSLDVACNLIKSEGIAFVSPLSYTFRLFPGSCEVDSISENSSSDDYPDHDGNASGRHLNHCRDHCH